MNITLRDNLAGADITREDGASFALGPKNPETLALWRSTAEIERYAQKAAANPNVWAFPQPEPEAQPAALSTVAFMTLMQVAGGITDEEFIEIMQTATDPKIVKLRIMLELQSTGITPDNDALVAGLNDLVTTNYLTQEERSTVLAAWPTE